MAEVKRTKGKLVTDLKSMCRGGRFSNWCMGIEETYKVGTLQSVRSTVASSCIFLGFGLVNFEWALWKDGAGMVPRNLLDSLHATVRKGVQPHHPKWFPLKPMSLQILPFCL